ncbi:MAG: prepilin-type N-terminal cleavage/methylation domain-containing protein [Candidatus Omnitrophota bacterium]
MLFIKAKKTRNKTSAFTLIELLVVTVMLSVVCLAIYSTFASGARIWQRINRMSLNEEVNIFFDRFSSDVRNSVKFSGLRFTGKPDGFDLPTLVSSPTLEAKTAGMAIYSCSGDILARSQADYSQIYQDVSVPPRHILGGLQSCNFTYYQYDEEKEEYSWVEEWVKDELPLAVRMALSVNTAVGIQDLVKTVSIPVAGRKEKNE